ncbi:MAG: DegT/DnrJ/EryC1/StrS aminotransferase family protein, partial [Rhodocyclaceae bacterium]|nr:DegT/DnrJ/EryC1/StrS aminotransferase family protein [Rhodocyclaceae bacterium]
AYYKYYAFVAPEKLAPGWDATRINEAVNAEGVPCFAGSCSEIYLERAFVNRGWGPPERLPTARQLGDTSLMFMLHPTLGESEMTDTIRAVSKVMRAAVQ